MSSSFSPPVSGSTTYARYARRLASARSRAARRRLHPHASDTLPLWQTHHGALHARPRHAFDVFALLERQEVVVEERAAGARRVRCGRRRDATRKRAKPAPRLPRNGLDPARPRIVARRAVAVHLALPAREALVVRRERRRARRQKQGCEEQRSHGCVRRPCAPPSGVTAAHTPAACAAAQRRPRRRRQRACQAHASVRNALCLCQGVVFMPRDGANWRHAVRCRYVRTAAAVAKGGGRARAAGSFAAGTASGTAQTLLSSRRRREKFSGCCRARMRRCFAPRRRAAAPRPPQ